MILPAITLYQPWATWIMRGWKTIETRTHNRFACLNGKTILIHAGLTTDALAINNPYLTIDQILQDPDEVTNGYILGSAHVGGFDKLKHYHSEDALIDCGSVERYGLFLFRVKKFDTPFKVAGEMGIWYFDMAKMQKVKKEKQNLPQLF